MPHMFPIEKSANEVIDEILMKAENSYDQFVLRKLDGGLKPSFSRYWDIVNNGLFILIPS